MPSRVRVFCGQPSCSPPLASSARSSPWPRDFWLCCSELSLHCLQRSAARRKRSSLHPSFPRARQSTGSRRPGSFLFAARDVWFVVGLPVFLAQLGWSFSGVGAFIALWFVGYGIIQAFVPDILRSIGRVNVDGPGGPALGFHFAYFAPRIDWRTPSLPQPKLLRS